MSLKSITRPSRPFISSFALCRQFSSNSVLRDDVKQGAIQKEKLQAKEQNKKAELKRALKKKNAARALPSTSPLYMKVSDAMKYLRAAEVGRPVNESVISLLITVFAERGTPQITGNIVFPTAFKETKILVFTNNPEQAELCTKMGAAKVGGTELIAQIQEGKVPLNFDSAFATPEIASQLNPIAKNLGSRGLFPSVKRGTVSENVSELVSSALGTVVFRQKNNAIGIAIGRAGFTDAQILKNIIAASQAVKQSVASMKTKKPPIVGQTVLSSTHGPGLVIDF